MSAETQDRVIERKDEKHNNREFRNTVEYFREGYERTRRDDGVKYLALALGGEYQENQIHNGRRKYDRPYSPQQQAIRELLPEIQKDPELYQIFLTSHQLVEAYHEAWGRNFRLSDLSTMPKEALDKRNKLTGNLRLAISNYTRQVLAASKPGVSTEQLPEVPKLCVPATAYKAKDEAVPESHIHSCPICSEVNINYAN